MKGNYHQAVFRQNTSEVSKSNVHAETEGLRQAYLSQIMQSARKSVAKERLSNNNSG